MLLDPPGGCTKVAPEIPLSVSPWKPATCTYSVQVPLTDTVVAVCLSSFDRARFSDCPLLQSTDTVAVATSDCGATATPTNSTNQAPSLFSFIGVSFSAF